MKKETYVCGFCGHTEKADEAPLCSECLNRTNGSQKSRMVKQQEDACES